MNEDRDWKELGEAWKEGIVTDEVAGLARQVRSAARWKAWRTGAALLVVLAAVATITLAVMLHRSVAAYTFTVIAWSAVFALASFLLATRESAGDYALATTSALAVRVRKLGRRAQVLEFGRVLVGVEALICFAYWIVLHVGHGRVIWVGALAIGAAGTAVYNALVLGRSRARRELQALGAVKLAMESSDR
jgi:hypothetical protein